MSGEAPAPGNEPAAAVAAADEDAETPADGMGGVGLVAKLRAVLRVKDFRKLWLSMSLSSFGDWLGLLAITATATSLATSFAAANFALGGVLLFRLLPAIVLGPLAGAFADRFDRRKTMVVADIMRFALFASIPLVDNLVWLFVASSSSRRSACSGSRPRTPPSRTCSARTSWSRPTSSPWSPRTGSPRSSPRSCSPC